MNTSKKSMEKVILQPFLQQYSYRYTKLAYGVSDYEFDYLINHAATSKKKKKRKQKQNKKQKESLYTVYSTKR